MIREIEHEARSIDQLDTPTTNQDALANIKPFHGVSPETHGLLLFARKHEEILGMVDASDKNKRITNPTRNLLYVYYFNDVSIRDLIKHVGGKREASGKRILEALEIIWENVPPETQLQYPKERAVALKDQSSISPQTTEKLSKASKASWQREEYRQKSKQSRGNNPAFIQHMSDVKKGTPNPAKGTNIPEQRLEKIREGVQKYWNKKQGLELTIDLSTKRRMLLDEWIRLTQLLGHTPSSLEIRRMKKNSETKFSEYKYATELGKGNYKEAKPLLTCLADIQTFAETIIDNPLAIVPYPVAKKDVLEARETILAELSSILALEDIDELGKNALALKEKIQRILKELTKKPHAVSIYIEEDERLMWESALANNLQDGILAQGNITQEDLDLMEEYFGKGLIGDGLNIGTFNRFSLDFVKIRPEQ